MTLTPLRNAGRSLISPFCVLDKRTGQLVLSQTKILAWLLFGFVAYINLDLLRHGKLTDIGAVSGLLFMVSLAAAFGRGSFDKLTPVAAGRLTGATTTAFNASTNLNATVTGDVVEAIKAWRDTPHDGETSANRSKDPQDVEGLSDDD